MLSLILWFLVGEFVFPGSFSYGQKVTGQEQNWVELSPVVRRGQARGSLVGGGVDPHHSGCSVG